MGFLIAPAADGGPVLAAACLVVASLVVLSGYRPRLSVANGCVGVRNLFQSRVVPLDRIQRVRRAGRGLSLEMDDGTSLKTEATVMTPINHALNRRRRDTMQEALESAISDR